MVKVLPQEINEVIGWFNCLMGLETYFPETLDKLILVGYSPLFDYFSRGKKVNKDMLTIYSINEFKTVIANQFDY